MPSGDVGEALERGSAYLDGMYGRRFSGSPTGGIEQTDEWPRTGAMTYHGEALASDAVPTRIVQAAYEAALLELANPGSLTTAAAPDQRKVLTKLDVMEWEVLPGKTPHLADGPLASAIVSTRIHGLVWPFLASELPAVMVV